MFQAFAKVTTGVDKTNDIKKLLDDLAKKQVYVGIPEGSNTEHSNEGDSKGSGGITNAELLYIHTHGIRKREMIDEMNGMMGITSGGMPYTKDYNNFLDNMSNGVPYSTAYKMYIQSHGSPLWRSPPRPVIEPAIEYNKEVIAKQLKKAVQTALDGENPIEELNKAGMLGQNVARDWFTNPANNWPPNSPITVNGSKPDKNGKQFIKGKGSSQPLIDTGELRRSITYVVSDRKK